MVCFCFLCYHPTPTFTQDKCPLYVLQFGCDRFEHYVCFETFLFEGDSCEVCVLYGHFVPVEMCLLAYITGLIHSERRNKL